MERGVAVSNAHNDLRRKWERLVNFFEVTSKVRIAYTHRILLNNSYNL